MRKISKNKVKKKGKKRAEKGVKKRWGSSDNKKVIEKSRSFAIKTAVFRVKKQR
jgi:hypothetical protein